jgi:hypothetical protein
MRVFFPSIMYDGIYVENICFVTTYGKKNYNIIICIGLEIN